MKTYIFRVDGNSKIGSGHLIRCVNIAKQINKSYQIEFICVENKNLQKILKSFKINSIPRTNNSWLGNTWQEDCNKTIDIIKDKSDIFLIIDQYSIDEKWETKIRPFVKTIMVIDDLHNRNHNCDILLDQNIYFNNPYTSFIPKNCKLLLGPKYGILNKTFQKTKRIRTSIKRVYIFFGGSDQYNLTERLLEEIININIIFDVVIGSLNKNYENILKKYSKYKNINIHYSVNQDKIADIIYNSDLAIGSSGVSAYERCISGLFSLVVTFADNQISNANNLHKLNVIDYVGKHSDDKIIYKIYVKLKKYIEEDINWEKISTKCMKIIDGNGLYRISNFL